MAGVASKFDTGVEAMRQKAVDCVEAWHHSVETDKLSMTNAEVHELINAIAGDIRVVKVEGN